MEYRDYLVKSAKACMIKKPKNHFYHLTHTTTNTFMRFCKSLSTSFISFFKRNVSPLFSEPHEIFSVEGINRLANCFVASGSFCGSAACLSYLSTFSSIVMPIIQPFLPYVLPIIFCLSASWGLLIVTGEIIKRFKAAMYFSVEDPEHCMNSVEKSLKFYFAKKDNLLHACNKLAPGGEGKVDFSGQNIKTFFTILYASDDGAKSFVENNLCQKLPHGLKPYIRESLDIFISNEINDFQRLTSDFKRIIANCFSQKCISPSLRSDKFLHTATSYNHLIEAMADAKILIKAPHYIDLLIQCVSQSGSLRPSLKDFTQSSHYLNGKATVASDEDLADILITAFLSVENTISPEEKEKVAARLGRILIDGEDQIGSFGQVLNQQFFENLKRAAFKSLPENSSTLTFNGSRVETQINKMTLGVNAP